MLKYAVALAAALSASSAYGADLPRYAPPPAWVKPLTIPAIAPSTDGSAVQILLQNSQTRLGAEADEFFTEAAVRILTPQGLAAFGNIPESWDPATETLTFHRLDIIRGDKRIDLLEGGKKVTVLRRETNLNLAMLDGALTATVQPEGLQVGDVVDIQVGLERRDPVRRGHSEQDAFDRHPGLAGRLYLRTLWPNAKPIRWRATDGLTPPALTQNGEDRELVIDETDAVAPKPPRGAPARFANVGELQVTQFQSWREVSAQMAPYYAKAETLAVDSPLHAEADKIRKASNDPKTRAEAALRLVEDQVHYVALNMNFGGFVPADADVSWTRRFGDCKGKSVLLVALLHELGVEADVVLVNTQGGDALHDHLPMLGMFDHAIVRAKIAGKIYWLDGTRIGDRGLDDIPVPSFHWVLPVEATGAELVDVMPPPFAEPAFESLERLDASAGYDSPAPAHIEHIYRGDAALVWHVALDSAGAAEADRALREHWRSSVPWIDAKTVSFAYDEPRHLMRLTLDGMATMNWTRNGSLRDFDIGDSNLGFETSFKREPGPNQDAPFTVSYPDDNKWTVLITLPNHGAGFLLGGGTDTDQTIAQRRYTRQTRIEDGVVTMVAQEQSLAPEFPFADAAQAATRLRDLHTWDVIVRGPSTAEASRIDAASLAEDGPPTAAPTDARGFDRRGASYLRRNDYPRAIADFSEAVRLAPTAGVYHYNRGAAHLAAGHTELAFEDFTQALRINPRDGLALAARGEIYLIRHDEARATADFNQAVILLPADTGVLTRIALAYDRAGLFEKAVRGFDAALAKTTDPYNRAPLLNGRCWAKGEWGQELESGVADCTAALAIVPGDSGALDSRGFVHLRLGQYDKAIDDYDAALRISPTLASSLYGRGLAEARSGQAAKAATDLAAGKAASASVVADFARYGLVPAGVTP